MNQRPATAMRAAAGGLGLGDQESPRSFLRDLPIARKLLLILMVFVLTVGGVLAAGLAGMSALSGIRAYIVGEAFWSKAQKDGVHHLMRYAYSLDEDDYQAYLKAIAIPLGGTKARRELEKPDPDFGVVVEGLIEGRNHPDDMRMITILFRRFGRVGYMKKAIGIWRSGDALIVELRRTADDLHRAVSAGQATPERTDQFVREIIMLNEQLTRLEEGFSLTLSEGARWLYGLLLRGMLLVAALMLGGGLAVSVALMRQIGGGISALDAAARRVGRGDFSHKVTVASQDELGRLAASFNQMIGSLTDLVAGHIRSEEEIRRLNTSLEQRVAERTAQLAEQGQELREAKGFLEHLIATSQVTMMRIDLHDVTLTYVSPNVQRLLGYPAQEIIGVPMWWPEHIHSEDRERVLADLARLPHGPADQVELEHRLLHKDGNYRWIYAVLRLERDHAGNPASVLAYGVDITDRKAAEEALQLAKEEAERASLAKSEFLSRMSHELRTPMNAILGFAQLLEMDNPTPEAREGIEHILKGGQHLLQLINEVLDIARIEAGRLVISPEPVRLREVGQESLDLIAPLAAQQQVQLNADLVLTYEGYVQADRQRLKQVLLNLLSNAVKYNRQGGAVVLSCEETLRGRLRVKVSDTGRGIPPEKLQRLFLPFERLGVERSGIDGAGIGLALSRGLIELMGGDIGVESEVGQGSTFWVDLALAESPTERYHRMSEEVPLPAAADGGILLRSLLYIEDNLANLELIQRVLDRWPQVKLLSAMQGRLGLELARQHRPDLILLDLHLPDVTGDELLRRLRETPETQRIPVVVLTADASQGQVDRLLAIGARDFLTKPLDVKRLLKVLSEPLKERAHTHP